MSTFTSFAIAGAGGLGSLVAAALAEHPGLSVIVLSRSASTVVPPNVTLKVVDYTSPESLAAALVGVQVVISTLNGAGFASQTPLADASKAAGVALFVPSEFGVPTEGVKEGPLVGKENLAKHLASIGLPSLRVFTGVFSDFLFAPFAGFDFAGGKVSFIGKGDTPIGFTARPDIARFLAFSLTTLPFSSLSNQIFRIEGDRKSFNEVVALYERTHPGSSIAVTRTPVADAQKQFDADPTQFLLYLGIKLEEGHSPYASGKLNNGLFPEWKPKTIESILAVFP